MRIIATDDDARRQEFVLFGFGEKMSFPTPARIPAVATWVFLTPTLAFLFWVLTPFVDLIPLPAPVVFLIHAAGCAAAAAAVATLTVRAVGKRVTPVTPWRHLIASLQGELNTPRTPTDDVVVRLITANVPVLWIESDPTFQSVTSITPALRIDE